MHHGDTASEAGAIDAPLAAAAVHTYYWRFS
jgi:hypothetical protein